MQLPQQRPRVEPVPGPEPPSPSLPTPDPGVFRPDAPEKSPSQAASNVSLAADN